MDDTAATAEDILRIISWAYVVLFFVAIALWLRRQRRVIATELEAEVEAGLISGEEARVAASFTQRTLYELRQVRAGDLEAARRTSTLSRELAELAFTKHRLEGVEDPRDEIEERRDRVRLTTRALHPHASPSGSSS